MLCHFSFKGLYVCVQANNDQSVFLERGRRGIVPCPPIASRKIDPASTDYAYWYYPRPQRGSLLISYFRGIVAPQNGIPEGVYDIDRNFSLVIENVTDSHEGTYFFKVKARQEAVQGGKVTVAVWCK